MLGLYQTKFALGFPLPKVDMVAIPNFAAGAMENWGLVLYREGSLLVDAERSSEADKQSVVITVAHELAHQWSAVACNSCCSGERDAVVRA